MPQHLRFLNYLSIIKETLIKSFVHIAPSDFLGKLAENMQARCANSFQRDLFSVSLKNIYINISSAEVYAVIIAEVEEVNHCRAVH